MMNLVNMMKRAHEMARAARMERPGIDYRSTLGAALKALWYDAHGGARAEWESMSGTEQQERLLRAVWYARKREMALDRWGAALEWITTPDDAATVAADAWIILESGGIDRATEKGRSLQGALYLAAVQAARQIDRAERRHASALRYDEAPGDDYDARRAYIIDNAAPIAEPIAPAPDVYAATLDEIERAAADDIDRAIIAMLAAGYTQADAARRLDVSRAAVCVRVANIRQRHAAAAMATARA